VHLLCNFSGTVSSLNLENNLLGELVLPEGWTAPCSPGWKYTHRDGREGDEKPPEEPVGAIAIANAIKSNGSLSDLNLANNNLGATIVKLDDGWEDRLRECVLGFDKDQDGILSEQELGAFIKALGIDDIKATIQYFCYDAVEASEDYLQDGNLSVEGLLSIYRRAKTTRPKDVTDNLRTLELLSAKSLGIIAVADAIKDDVALTKLNLSNNKLNFNLKGEAAAAPGRALADALATNTILKEVYLSGNYLKPEFAQELAVGIEKNRTLLLLDIKDNSIGDEGKIALGRAIQISNVQFLICDEWSIASEETQLDVSDKKLVSAWYFLWISKVLTYFLLVPYHPHQNPADAMLLAGE
jgi:hypothetical protein